MSAHVSGSTVSVSCKYWQLESGAQVREEGEGKIATNSFHNTKCQTEVIPNDRKWLITLILSGLQKKEC